MVFQGEAVSIVILGLVSEQIVMAPVLDIICGTLRANSAIYDWNTL